MVMTGGSVTEPNNFYQTFVTEVQQRTFKADSRIANSKFRKFIITQLGATLETLYLLRDSLAVTVQKPQRCLYADTDWYLAVDTYTSTYYVCYQQLLMVDIDYGKGNQYLTVDPILAKLREYAKLHPDLLLEVYASGKGVHVFVISQPHNYQCDASLTLMLELGCDFYYAIYASIRGWSVRVNAKLGETAPIYTKITRIGTGQPDDHLVKLVQLHLNFLPVFAQTMESRMY